MLRTLTPREERIIKMRFGLDDGSEHTLEEVGQVFDVTRKEFVRLKRSAGVSYGIRHARVASEFFVESSI